MMNVRATIRCHSPGGNSCGATICAADASSKSMARGVSCDFWIAVRAFNAAVIDAKPKAIVSEQAGRG